MYTWRFRCEDRDIDWTLRCDFIPPNLAGTLFLDVLVDEMRPVVYVDEVNLKGLRN
jgi:hypothetical protein